MAVLTLDVGWFRALHELRCGSTAPSHNDSGFSLKDGVLRKARPRDVRIDLTPYFLHAGVGNDDERNEFSKLQKLLTIPMHEFQRVFRFPGESCVWRGIEDKSQVGCRRVPQEEPGIRSRCKSLRVNICNLVVDVAIEDHDIKAFYGGKYAVQPDHIQDVKSRSGRGQIPGADMFIVLGGEGTLRVPAGIA